MIDKKYEEIIGMDGPKLRHPRMPVSDRAKIFAPFAALKGFEEAVERRRRDVDKPEEDN